MVFGEIDGSSQNSDGDSPLLVNQYLRGATIDPIEIKTLLEKRNIFTANGGFNWEKARSNLSQKIFHER